MSTATATVTSALEATSEHGFEVGKAGFGGVQCDACSYIYTLEQSSNLIPDMTKDGFVACHNCSCEYYSLDSFEIVVRSDNAHLFDVDETRKAKWFHATTKQDWHEVILSGGDESLSRPSSNPEDDNSIMVHLGTLDAALDRARLDFSDCQWFLYEVKLNDSAEISGNVFPDEEVGWPEHAYECEDTDYVSNGASRYVNAFESHGSISLLVHPKAFTVTSVIEGTFPF